MARKHLVLLAVILSPCLSLGAFSADIHSADSRTDEVTPLVIAEATVPLPPAVTADLQHQAAELFGPLPPAMAGGQSGTPFRIRLGRELFNSK